MELTRKQTRELIDILIDSAAQGRPQWFNDLIDNLDQAQGDAPTDFTIQIIDGAL